MLFSGPEIYRVNMVSKISVFGIFLRSVNICVYSEYVKYRKYGFRFRICFTIVFCISRYIQKNFQIKSSSTIFLVSRSNGIAVFSEYDCCGAINFDVKHEKCSLPKRA